MQHDVSYGKNSQSSTDLEWMNEAFDDFGNYDYDDKGKLCWILIEYEWYRWVWMKIEDDNETDISVKLKVQTSPAKHFRNHTISVSFYRWQQTARVT